MLRQRQTLQSRRATAFVGASFAGGKDAMMEKKESAGALEVGELMGGKKVALDRECLVYLPVCAKVGWATED